MLIEQLPVEVSRDRIKVFCTRHHIRRMMLFGSILREDFTATSDVDILVEFAPDAVPGLIRLEMMQMELSGILQRQVDLLTPNSLHASIRDDILRHARVIYDAA